MNDDMVKRLRNTTHMYQINCELKMKCADRIEELEARLEAVEKERDIGITEGDIVAHMTVASLHGELLATKARAEKAEAALATARRDGELLNRIVLPMVEQRSREKGDAWDQAANTIRAIAAQEGEE